MDDIEITLNGFKMKVPKDMTIARLIVLSDEEDPHLIVELNGRFLYADQYEKTGVSEGDRIEFINPNFGG